MLDHLRNLYDQAQPQTVDDNSRELVENGYMLVYGSDTVQYCVFGERCQSHGMHYGYAVIDLEIPGNVCVFSYEKWEDFRAANPLTLHDFRKVDMKEVRDTAADLYKIDRELLNAWLDAIQLAYIHGVNPVQQSHRRRRRK